MSSSERKKPTESKNKTENETQDNKTENKKESHLDILNKLPISLVKRNILFFLDRKDVLSISQSSSQSKELIDEHLELERLLNFVGKGNQKEAEKIIKKNPNLLLKKGSLTDYSKRTFKKITAFQYALWAVDMHMWEMIRKYLPNDLAASQLEDLETNKVEYKILKLVAEGLDSLNAKEVEESITEKHYDFGIITALQEFINQVNIEGNTVSTYRNWIASVGRAERLLPAHLVNEIWHRSSKYKPFTGPAAVIHDQADDEGKYVQWIDWHSDDQIDEDVIAAMPPSTREEELTRTVSIFFPLDSPSTTNGRLGCIGNGFAIGINQAGSPVAHDDMDDVGRNRERHFMAADLGLSFIEKIYEARMKNLEDLKLELLGSTPEKKVHKGI